MSAAPRDKPRGYCPFNCKSRGQQTVDMQRRTYVGGCCVLCSPSASRERAAWGRRAESNKLRRAEKKEQTQKSGKKWEFLCKFPRSTMNNVFCQSAAPEAPGICGGACAQKPYLYDSGVAQNSAHAPRQLRGGGATCRVPRGARRMGRGPAPRGGAGGGARGGGGGAVQGGAGRSPVWQGVGRGRADCQNVEKKISLLSHHPSVWTSLSLCLLPSVSLSPFSHSLSLALALLQSLAPSLSLSLSLSLGLIISCLS